METKNHYALSRRIISAPWFDAQPLHKQLFLLGSLYPDINLFTYVRGHTYKGAHHIMKKHIKALEGKVAYSAWDYWRMGILIHYVADVFTASHSSDYTGTLMEHRRYEKRLRVVFSKKLEAFRASSLKARLAEPLAYLREKQREYRAARASCDRDSEYIIQVCSQLVMLLRGKAAPEIQPMATAAGD